MYCICICTVLYCTALYCIVLYRTVSYRTVLYRTVPYRTVQYRTVPYRIVLYCIVLYCTVPYRTVPYRTVPYCPVPYCTVLYRTAPYCIASYRTVPHRTAPYCTVMACSSQHSSYKTLILVNLMAQYLSKTKMAEIDLQVNETSFNIVFSSLTSYHFVKAWSYFSKLSQNTKFWRIRCNAAILTAQRTEIDALHCSFFNFRHLCLQILTPDIFGAH